MVTSVRTNICTAHRVTMANMNFQLTDEIKAEYGTSLGLV